VRRSLAAVGIALVAVLTLTACGGGSSAGAGATPTVSPSGDPQLAGMQQKVDSADSAAAAAESDAAQNYDK
jgi:uncharacterized lipoprotein YajG